MAMVSATTLKAPFPYFGGKALVAADVWERLGDVPNYVDLRCKSQSQLAGCRPVRLVSLFVDHRADRLAWTHLPTAFCRYAGTWISKCRALLTSSRFPMLSFNLSSSLWWTPMPRGMGPWDASQTTCALSFQTFGSATLTQARCSPPRL